MPRLISQTTRIYLLLLLLAVISPRGFAQEPTPSPVQPPNFLTKLRIWFVADDPELEALHQIIEKAEHAVEPPMAEEGFWQRKLEILKSLSSLRQWEMPPVFDFRRSFQNVTRLLEVSKDYNPAGRDLLVSSAVMFALTHGSEFAIGAVAGTWNLFQGDVAEATAFYGLAIPGLYDFGCWIGQGVLLTRPGRQGFTRARKFVMTATGKAVQTLGIGHVLNKYLERKDVKQYLMNAATNAPHKVLTFEMSEQEALSLKLKNKEGTEIATLQFANGREKHQLQLEQAILKPGFSQTSFSEIARHLSGLRWNVVGALRQIHYLLRTGQVDLISHETTFVRNVSGGGTPQEAHEITFEPHSVWLTSPFRRKGPCQEVMAQAAE